MKTHEGTDASWSVPEADVWEAVKALRHSENAGVLATIIDVDGSAYRRPGAKMVIPDGEAGVGHITAGCLEEEVQEVAQQVIESDKPIVKTYDLRPDEDEDVWGLGVGCNGTIRILLEPITSSIDPLLKARESDGNMGAIAVIDGPKSATIGDRVTFDVETATFHSDSAIPSSILDDVAEEIGARIRNNQPGLLSVNDWTLFVERPETPQQLVICGTGHDLGPIVTAGKRADFHVTVVGFRGANAREDRFPDADAVYATSPTRIGETVSFDADTYVVIATHSFLDDRLALEAVLETDVPYIGLMGPSDRFEDMVDDLADEGKELTSRDRERIYTPIGLDLGGGTPHQIAISVLAEILAVANEREPGHLRHRDGPIHDRNNE